MNLETASVNVRTMNKDIQSDAILDQQNEQSFEDEVLPEGSSGAKSIVCQLKNQTIEKFNTTFVTNMVFQHVGLSWIIKSNQKLNFYFQMNCPIWVINSSWYNTIICSQLHGLLLGYYFITAKRDRYNAMCSIKDHKIKNKYENDEASTGGGITLPYNPTEEALI